MKTSDEINDIAKALVEVQGCMSPAKMSTNNPFFNKYYADLNAVWDALRIPLHNNGLAVIQEAMVIEGCASVSTRIVHTSGQWIECGPVTIPMKKNDAHASGSAITYGKRYALVAALGLSGERDDDGNKAVQEDTGKKDAPQDIQQDMGHKCKLSVQQMQAVKSSSPFVFDKLMGRLKSSYGFEKLSDVTADHYQDILEVINYFTGVENATRDR